jgi:molybdopterin converting factor subunit 1
MSAGVEVKVLFFAAVRDRLGRAAQTLTWTQDEAQALTVADVKAKLSEAYPQLAALWPALRVAVNCDFEGDDAPVRGGDEVALIPPVAGGIDTPDDSDDPAGQVLKSAPLDAEAVNARVTHPGAGAVVTFVGVVRDNALGRAVDFLEYEVYPAMAIKKLREVEAAIEADFPGARCAVCHRYGKLWVGDVAVVVAVSAPHRAQGFAACAAGIDMIKAVVPIWKREVGPDGSAWVGIGS